jgi:hypothetical protein
MPLLLLQAKMNSPRLTVEYIDGRNWKLVEPFVYGDWYVPAGFVTDFASVPRFFWRLLPPAGNGQRAAYGYAAVVHDWLYRRKHRFMSRRTCDRVFLELMRQAGVARWRRWTMYAAVRCFGWLAFKK